MSEIEKNLIEVAKATKAQAILIERYTKAIDEWMKQYRPEEGTISGDCTWHINQWVLTHDLPKVLRREKYQNMTDDQLHDSIDEMLDELYAREKHEDD